MKKKRNVFFLFHFPNVLHIRSARTTKCLLIKIEMIVIVDVCANASVANEIGTDTSNGFVQID